ncbi:MAG: glycosyl hydrolase, partial [Bacteroidetes bacterium]|nr:glycosyl hydrolase [Bacteroidota bacterium]
IKKIRAINEKLDAFVTSYKDNAEVAELVAKAKELKEQFSSVEKALYQTQNRSGQDPLNFPIRLTNKLAHLNSLVSLDDFGPTDQDRVVKAELTAKIETELNTFNALIDSEIDAFNKAFNEKQLPFLQLKD